ncbi:MAG TPA: DEAD/DEAH box helicase [Oligoflexia bacterium]|nr:DEAD/DEAH box helicase [Oligoflexia bacterium]
MVRDRKHIQESRKELLSGIGIPEPAPFRADRFQLQAVESLLRGDDTLVIAPTGTGKTYIAVEAIRHIAAQGKRAIYTAPLKALSNTKYTEFKKLFEPQFRVGLLTGDRKIETDADVVVATTEIYRNDLYSYCDSYSLVVLDELHYLADIQRGPVWEESIILSPKSVTLLMLSASISNPHEIADWISTIRGKSVSVILEDRRPVPLRLGFLHPELGLLPLEEEKGKVFPEVHQFYSEGGLERNGFSRRGGGSRRRGRSRQRWRR